MKHMAAAVSGVWTVLEQDTKHEASGALSAIEVPSAMQLL